MWTGATRCRLFETCDQAVLLSGGWNRLHSDQRSRLNVLHMYRMFRHAGFHKHNIKVFFANGRDNVEGEGESTANISLGVVDALAVAHFKLGLQISAKNYVTSFLEFGLIL